MAIRGQSGTTTGTRCHTRFLLLRSGRRPNAADANAKETLFAQRILGDRAPLRARLDSKRILGERFF